MINAELLAKFKAGAEFNYCPQCGTRIRMITP